MKIQHREYGEVDGVRKEWNVIYGHCWERCVNGRTEVYVECKGWSEVKEKQWVDVMGVIYVDPNSRALCVDDGNGPDYIMSALHLGYRLRRCEMYDLPDDLLHDVYHFTPKGVIEYIQRFKRPCLIVEQEQ